MEKWKFIDKTEIVNGFTIITKGFEVTTDFDPANMSGFMESLMDERGIVWKEHTGHGERGS